MNERHPPQHLLVLSDHPQPEQRPASVSVAVDPELLAGLSEAKRLFEEAIDRLQHGDVLPALSSLAAVPPLHGWLMSQCSELRTPDETESEPETPCGLYL